MKRSVCPRFFAMLALCASGASQTGYFRDGSVVIVPSSHQDIAWMDSPENCRRDRDRLVITPALELLERNPNYRIVMEAAYMLEEYLETHPERKEQIGRLMEQGRLGWGATYVEPYESSYSGESLIRGLYFGRRWIRKLLPGCDTVAAWNVDVPARSLQFQQILAKAGVKYLVISRHAQGFYRWLSPDGSGVLVWSPGIYDASAVPIQNKPFAEASRNVRELLAKWAPYYAARRIAPVFPIMATTDMAPPETFDTLMADWAKADAGLPPLRYASDRELLDEIARGEPDLPVLRGERPNVWVYIHGPCHHEALSAAREAAILLTSAEKFSTVAALLAGSFRGYPVERLSRAWKAQIYPDHGWGGFHGDITDRIFKQKYEYARAEGRAQLEAALKAIAARVRTDPARGRPVVVFNGLSWQRSDPVVLAGGPYRVLDGRGAEVPAQQTEEGVLFVASGVPSIGYKTYYLQPAGKTAQEVCAATRFENRFYRIDLAPGGVRQIHDKQLHADLLRTDKFLGGEVFTMQSVGNGAGEFAAVQQPTMEGFDKLSLHKPAWTCEESGPVRTVFRLEAKLPHVIVRERLIVYASVKRIDLNVSLLGWDGARYREFRVAVPVNAEGGATAYEVPFGTVRVGLDEIPGAAGEFYTQRCLEVRPREVQDWMNVSGDSFGLTMSSSVAVFDYADPTPDAVRYPVLQPLLLASRKSCHPKGNWYLQPGDHHYRFSVFSHRPGWQEGYRAAKQASAPLWAVNVAANPLGTLATERSFFSTSAANVLISTIKKAEDADAVIVRLYEAEGRDAQVRIACPFAARSVAVTNILEQEGRRLPGTSLRVGHHAIETLEFRPWRRGH